MRLHVEALFTVDKAGRLLAVNDPRGAPAPRFFLGRTTDHCACWCRHDLDGPLVKDLHTLCASLRLDTDMADSPSIATLFAERLSREGRVEQTWAGPAYVVPPEAARPGTSLRVTSGNADLLRPYLEPWLEDVRSGMPMAVAMVGDNAVSVCGSVRITSHAHEAGVDTHPDFRRRGFGEIAVRGWADIVRAMGRVPLYSTSWENTASRALAKRLGLVQFGADLHIT